MDQENQKGAEDALDVLWGVPGPNGIAAAIGRTPVQTFRLLELGMLPAKKVGKQWTSTRSALRGFFENLTAADAGAA